MVGIVNNALWGRDQLLTGGGSPNLPTIPGGGGGSSMGDNPIAPALKKGSAAQYDSVMSTFKPDAQNYVDSVGKHMTDAKKYAADNGYEYDQNEYNNALTRWTANDAANKKTYQLGTSIVSGGDVKKMYGDASGGGQSVSSMGDAILKNAVTSGATTTQLAAALQNINPNLKPEQVAEFIRANNLHYVVNANGTISSTATSSSTDVPTAGDGVGATPPPPPGATPPPAANTGPETYQAQGVQTTDDMTVEGRMARLMDPNSARNQQLATAAKYQSADRGLINSSMGDSMIQDSIIRNAAGIAGTDAAMTAENARFSAGAQNQAGQFNADAANVLNRMSVQQQNDLAKMAKAQGYSLESMSVQQINDLAKMAVGQKNNLETLSSQFGFDLQKMDKSASIALGQMGVQQQNDVAKMALANGYNLQTMSAQQVNDLGKMAQAQTYVKENLGTQYSFDIMKMDKAAAITLGQMDKQQLNTVTNMATQHGFDMQKLSSQQASALAQIAASGETSKALAALNIDATKQLRISDQEFQAFTNKSTQAVGIMRDLQTGLTAIDRDPNITSAGAKTTAKDNLVKTVRGSLAVTQMVLTDASLTALMDSIFDGVAP